MKILMIIYKILIWSVISILGIFVEIKFIGFFIRDTAAGKDIFIPGVLILMLGISVVAVFAVTRVIKYVKILRANNENA